MDNTTMDIGKIGLSVRSVNALRRAQVHTVEEMLQFTPERLYEVRNLGKKSVEEILQKIDEYRRMDENKESPTKPQTADAADIPEDFEQWLETESAGEFVGNWLKDRSIDEVELLSPRAYNLLLLHGYEKLNQIVFLNLDALMEIPRMDPHSADEIFRLCRRYLLEKKEAILQALKETLVRANSQSIPTCDRIWKSEFREPVLQYVRANDQEVTLMGLPGRAVNQLRNNGYLRMSDMLFLKRADMLSWKGAGTRSVDAILKKIRDYVTEHETMLEAVMDGNTSVLLNDAVIAKMILQQYETVGFGGLNLQDFTERLPQQIEQSQLKRVIGSLLAAGELEYVDFRCYRIYQPFASYLELCQDIKDRSRDMLQRRLAGETLEEIAQQYDLTRERVRQILKKDSEKARTCYGAATGLQLFDEDYYRYLYETYAFDKKEVGAWLGIPESVWRYLDLMEIKQGDRDLQEALEDRSNLDAGLRLKIKNYLNRNKIYLDGSWIEKKRSALEDYVAKKFCSNDDISFTEFVHLYNQFLEQEEIEYDEMLYYTQAVQSTRKNRLFEARTILWKQNEKLRYYDIDSRDYAELFDALNLDAFENIEISTLKLMEEYPEIMQKYDIRDQYELHNLLRKTVPEGSFHDFHCCRMPDIRFGTFDRDSAMLDLLINNAPISQMDLVNLIHKEHGYDPGTILGVYLQPLSAYYHQGMYTVDQKVMPLSNMQLLQAVLTDDFYYIDEIKQIYAKTVPDADPEEINPYNLKTMGFIVLSRYVVQHHDSLEAYCRMLLTTNDMTDITPYRKRLTYVHMFSQVYSELKREQEIFEYEPNKIIHIRKLERAGITKEAIRAFCDSVDAYVEEETYFSINSLRLAGFESDLYDLGFSDWFYGNLLASDPRFSSTVAFGGVILYKGKASISIQSFAADRVCAHGSIDVYDLMTELEMNYGCKPDCRSDVLYKLQGSGVYHDKYLDRLYANEALYYRELDDVEGI